MILITIYDISLIHHINDTEYDTSLCNNIYGNFKIYTNSIIVIMFIE